jgi:hypothetical protein
MRRLPGATRSGFRRLSVCCAPSASNHAPRVGPRELNMLTTSSARNTVLRLLADPTVITEGSLPGEVTTPNCSTPAAFLP